MKKDPLPNPLPQAGEGAELPLPLAGEGRGEGAARRPAFSRNPGQISRARGLRRDLTPAERVLWSRLRADQLGIKIKRQVPCGPYILDFAALSAGIAIEIDGDTHVTSEAMDYDAKRTVFLRAQGIRVPRFTNREVVANRDGVLETIMRALARNPLPQAEEGAAPSPACGRG